MPSPPTTVLGFSSTDKAPGAVIQVDYGAGASSASSIPTTLLVVGYKLASGIATADVDVVEIRSSDDADLYFGAGSEVARMCYAALRTQGVNLKAMGLSEAIGASAATATISIGTTGATGSGSWSYRICGELLSGGISPASTPATLAVQISDAINARAQLPVVAAPNLGSVTLTWKNAGDRGNWGTLYQDTSRIPVNMVSTITGATAPPPGPGTLPGKGVHFTGGSGTEIPLAAIASLFAGAYDYVALAQNDLPSIIASNSWRESISAKASPFEARPSFVVITTADTYTMARTLSTAINDQLWQVLWHVNSETPPSEISAAFAALRQVTEAGDRGAAYDDAIVPGVVPHARAADSPQRADVVAALNQGLTPLQSTQDGKVKVSRSITTHCKNGDLADYRTLDTSDAVIPQFVRKVVAIRYLTSFKIANPRVADDPPLGAPDRPSGVGTPSLWNADLIKQLHDLEQGIDGSPPLLIDVDQNLPTSGYDKTARRIVSNIPLVVAPSQHQLGARIKQTSSV